MDSGKQRIRKRNRGITLSAQGQHRLQNAIARLEAQQNNGTPYSAEELSSFTGVSPSTLRRLWSAKAGVDLKSLQQIFSSFNLDLTKDDVQTFELPSSESSPLASGDVSPEAVSYRYPAGPLPLNSRLYIARSPIEDNAFREITQIGCVIRIKAPPGFGKSSLLLRALNHAQRLGYATALIDLQHLDVEILSNSDRFLQWFSAALALKLGVDSNPQTVWNRMVGSQLSATLYMREQILASINRPVLLAINDITRVFEYPQTAYAFLPLLRSWYEEAGHDDLWQHLRLVVTYSTDSYLPLDINVSPFNIGLPLALPEFNPDQVLNLAHLYRLSWSGQEVNQLMMLVGGHPSLVHLAIYQIHHDLVTLTELLQTAGTAKGIYRGYLQKLLAIVQHQPQLIEQLKSLVIGDSAIAERPSDDSDGAASRPRALEPMLAYQLEGTGLIKGTSDGWQISCELYRQYLQETLFSERNRSELP